MLRSSASQIFGDTTPQKQWAPRSSRLSFLSSPLQHAHTELLPSLITQSRVPTSASTSTSETIGAFSTPFAMFPRNQIEAMPPRAEENAELKTAWEEFTMTLILDSKTRHPVFFTDRLKRAPNGVDAGSWISPVAAGYVFEEHVDVKRREENARL